MKKLILILCAFIAITATAQTTPSYPTVKLTKPATGAGTDDILTIGASKNINKVSKASLLSGVATTTYVDAADATKEPIISSGTTSQYLRGDKSWQILNKTAVGLSNADNTSDANKPISMAMQSGLDLKANLASPTFTGTVSGITKSMIGLGNVDNTSDINKPISTANQTALNGKQNTSEKNQVNGYAGLGADGKIQSSQLPSITITDTYVVGSQAAMLSLVGAETGDVAVRTDLNKSFILKGLSYSTLTDWQELLTPTSAVTTVFGRNGSIVSQIGDYTTAQVTESGNLYYTDARVNANANVSANTAARHNAVTIGTANGLSLSTQALSLGLASSTSNGALSSTDWNTFNGKQNALGFTPYNSTNPNGYISSITSSNVTTALGYTPYNSTNPSGYITGLSWAGISSKPTTLAGFGITDAYPLSGNPSGFLTGISSAQVTGALGFTPYNSTNPSGFITTAGRAFPKKSDGTNVNFILSGTFSVAENPVSVLGTANGTDVYNYSTSQLNVNYAASAGSVSWSNVTGAPTNISSFTNNSGYITGINSSMVTSALGYTPYNSTNPNGYITSSGSITGSAGSVAWTNVSGRPTNISSFTNDSGYITGSYLPLSGGTVSGSITATAFYASSDKRLKNIISREGDMISYTWKDNRDKKIHYGYVAQEVKKEMPNQVQKDDNGYLAVNYIEVLVAKVNSLEKEVKRLKRKLK